MEVDYAKTKSKINYFEFLPDELLFEIVKRGPSDVLPLRCVSRRFKDFIDLFVIRSNSLPTVERYKRNYKYEILENIKVAKRIRTNLNGEDFYYNVLKKFLDTYFKWQAFILKPERWTYIYLYIDKTTVIDFDVFVILERFEYFEEIHIERYLSKVLYYTDTARLIRNVFDSNKINIKRKLLIDNYIRSFNEKTMNEQVINNYSSLYKVVLNKNIRNTVHLMDSIPLWVIKHSIFKQKVLSNLEGIYESSHKIKICNSIVGNGITDCTDLFYRITMLSLNDVIPKLNILISLLYDFDINVNCVFDGKTLFQIIFNRFKEIIYNKLIDVHYILTIYRSVFFHIAYKLDFNKSVCGQGQTLKESILALKKYKKYFIGLYEDRPSYCKLRVNQIEELIKLTLS